MAASTPRAVSNPKSEEQTKEALAEETRTPVDEVAKLYDEEFSNLAAEAKITQYLGVLTSRRVRMKLRRH
jgi:Protein of unknown function (DUF3562)